MMKFTQYRLSFLSCLHNFLQWRKRTMSAVIVAALSPIFAHANPNGAQVISGQVSIDQSIAGITTANAATKTYDGIAYSGGNGVIKADFVNGDTDAILAGTLSYGGNSRGAINAGTYAITPVGLTNGLGYAMAFADGALTIDLAALIVSLSGSRVYDGTTNVNAGIFTLSGLLNGQDLVLWVRLLIKMSEQIKPFYSVH